MSKQAEAINVYIEQQQKKINELVQQNMMLETKSEDEHPSKTVQLPSSKTASGL